MATRGDPITKVTLANGETRYRFRVDYGKKPDGSRDQRTITTRTRKDAQAKRRAILADRDRGVLVRPTSDTVRELVEAWLAGKRRIKDSTRATYRQALDLWLSKIGDVRVQQLTKKHLDAAATELLASGRRVGNKTSQALTPRTLAIGLDKLRAALTLAVRQGHVARNVAELVELPSHTPKAHKTWTAEQATSFLESVSGDRLYAAWCLSLYGLRRGEVIGLRWSDIDLAGIRATELGFPAGTATLAIQWTRGLVAGRVPAEGPPKTERSRRVLPLDDGLVTALTDFQLRQRAEAEDAGAAYGTCPLCQGAHVVADELGQPPWPSGYSQRFGYLCKAAGVPAIRLHDARHTTAVLMRQRGVDMAVISAWLGHTKPSFTFDTYGKDAQAAQTFTGAAATLRGALARTAQDRHK